MTIWLIALSSAPLFGAALLFVTPGLDTRAGLAARQLLLAEVVLAIVGVVGCIEIGWRHYPGAGWTIWPVWVMTLASFGLIHFVRFAGSGTRRADQ